ncbi:hypothetical protein EBQ90_03375 [bacterium]|nr:hypothetical protein [bacterium]
MEAPLHLSANPLDFLRFPKKNGGPRSIARHTPHQNFPAREPQRAYQRPRETTHREYASMDPPSRP